MLKVTEYVMLFAPVGVFGAVAAAITTQGIGVLATYGKFIGTFYVSLLLLWTILIGAGFAFLGGRVFALLAAVREPLLIAFTTASSEAAYPKLMERLDRFGVNERVTALTLPLGYSFNLDGSMVYQAFAALFIAQAYGIEMSIGTQITLLLVMMLSSKGIAGVPRASLVVVAAVLPMFGLPEAGLLLIMGIDQFLDMGRTATNVIGNGIATAVVAKWEGALGPPLPEESAETRTRARAGSGGMSRARARRWSRSRSRAARASRRPRRASGRTRCRAGSRASTRRGVVRLGYRENAIPFSYLGPDAKPVGYSLDLCQAVVATLAADLDHPARHRIRARDGAGPHCSRARRRRRPRVRVDDEHARAAPRGRILAGHLLHGNAARGARERARSATRPTSPGARSPSSAARPTRRRCASSIACGTFA